MQSMQIATQENVSRKVELEWTLHQPCSFRQESQREGVTDLQ